MEERKLIHSIGYLFDFLLSIGIKTKNAMKKLLLTFALILLSIGFGNAQDKFRADFNQIAFYDSETDKWSDWESAEHTLVFNYNSNNDIVHFTAQGETITYRNLGNTKESYTNGNHYQILDAIDEDGNLISIQLFDDPKIGMKIIYGNFIIQFAKY